MLCGHVELHRMWLEPLSLDSHAVYRGNVWKLAAWDAYEAVPDGRHWMRLMWMRMNGTDVLCIKMPDKRKLEEFEADYLDIVPGVVAGLNDPLLGRIAGSVDWFNWAMTEERI